MNVQLLWRIKVGFKMLLLLILVMNWQMPQANSADNFVQNEVLLVDAIQTIGRKYQVLFSYDRAWVENIRVSYDPAATNDLEEELEMVLDQTDLNFRVFDKRYVAVFRDTKEGVKTQKKMLEEIQELVEEEHQESRKTVMVQPLKSRFESYIPVKPLVINISGKVTDQDGEALIGVNIQIKGTTQGTSTGIDGEFVLEDIDENAVLVVSYIGYQTQEIPVASGGYMTITMLSDSQLLDEVVVVGYGTQKKSDLTGAVGNVASDDIVRANPVQVAKAIQGQVAGVNVTRVNGRPGADYNINIRGLNSINFSNEPLVVIDGVMGGNMNALNPADIESMDILKDASATAIYGSRGANGVIIITTKKGSSQRPSLSYSGYVGVKTPAHLPDMQNAQQFYQASVIDLTKNGGKPRSFTSTEVEWVESGRTTDWIDEITNPSLQTNHSISIGGGNETTNFHFSGGYLDEGGTLMHTKYQRYNIKGSMESKLNNIVKVGFTTNFSHGRLELGSNEGLRSAFRARPTGVVYTSDVLNPGENQELDWNGYASWMGINDKQVLNPIIEMDPENFRDETKSNTFFGNAYIQLTLLEGLTLKSALSANLYNDRFGQFRGTFTKSQKTTDNPRAYRNTTSISGITLDNILTYQKSVSKNNFVFTAVQSSFVESRETLNSYVNNLPYNSLWHAMGTSSTIDEFGTNLVERSLLSYMGRVLYDFDNRYYVTLTGRWDGASQLSPENKWAFFPSAAVAWRISNERFMEDSQISNLKVRVSYGLVGNSAVTPYSTQSRIINTPYDFGGNPAFGFAPENLADQSLKWEKSKELNLGVDIGFWSGRINASLEVYDRQTVDLIYREQIPTSTGFSSVLTNVGEVANRGVEFSIGSVNVAGNHFNWTSNVVFARNVNEVISIGSEGVKADISTNLFVGHPLGANYYYEYDGIWQLDEADQAAAFGQVPGSVRVVDQNRDGKISSNDGEDDRIILGSSQPDWTLGFTNKFQYKNFDFSFLTYTSQGVQYKNSMLSGTMGEVGKGRYNALNLNYWTVDNPSNDYPGPGISNPYGDAIFFQDASFIRISDITLGFSLPRATGGSGLFKNFRIYAQVSNPFIFHHFDGMDPEYNSGTYEDDLPSATYLLGIDLTF